MSLKTTTSRMMIMHNRIRWRWSVKYFAQQNTDISLCPLLWFCNQASYTPESKAQCWTSQTTLPALWWGSSMLSVFSFDCFKFLIWFDIFWMGQCSRYFLFIVLSFLILYIEPSMLSVLWPTWSSNHIYHSWPLQATLWASLPLQSPAFWSRSQKIYLIVYSTLSKLEEES